jgi:hypothetical protein
MNMHVDVGQFAVQKLEMERSIFGRLALALRRMFSAPKGECSWADGARGL